jgi:hypothetical protein
VKLKLVETPKDVRPRWTKNGPLCPGIACPSLVSGCASMLPTCGYVDRPTCAYMPCLPAVALMAAKLRGLQQ